MTAQVWLFLSFGGGLLLWMLNKANDRSNGVDMKVARWPDYFKVYWIPLVSRFVIDMALYGTLFNAELIAYLFSLVGLPSWAAGARIFGQYKIAAFGLGFVFDSQMDRFLASPVSDKIPIVRLIPAIPPPQKADPPPPTLEQVVAKVDAITEKEAGKQP